MKWLKRLYSRYMAGARANSFPITLFGRQNRVPRNLTGAVTAVERLVCADDKEAFLEWTETGFSARTHHNLGRRLRNRGELWNEQSRLYKWFRRKGIWHADDMSGIILTSYYRKLHSLPIKLDEQIKDYVDYWATESSLPKQQEQSGD